MLLYMINSVILRANLRQMVVCFAVFYTMKWRKPFYALLSMISPPLINLKITPSIFMANYSPSLFGEGLGERLCLSYIILPLIINNITPTIASPRNSVRVVPLIARGWRGTSLPRVNIRKEIQRRRCWAFSVKACLQWNLLWRINQKKHNTYGVVSHKQYVNPG